MKDYYKILGVDKKASEDEIKKAYRKLARKYHPDQNPNDKGAEARFKEISEAYETVGDESKRQEYDMMRLNPFAGGNFGGAPFGRQPGHPQQPNQGPGFSGFDDILNFMARGSRQQAPARGSDVETDVQITLEEAILGTSVMLHVSPPGSPPKKLKVSIPPGVSTGSKVRMVQEGDPGSPPGDLFVKVTVRPHALFTREGDDLHLELPVSVFDAVFGTEINVPTLEGEIRLKIPAGTQGGQVFRLKNKGVPALRGGTRGVLLIKVSLQLPEQISEADRELWRQLAARAASSGREAG
ncbi:MAG: CbpA [Cyanobacteria bacterium RYN_339]|nr:CbpA [Cyanobacteria bacterium RYN_339]